jgi:hypothetical protein
VVSPTGEQRPRTPPSLTPTWVPVKGFARRKPHLKHAPRQLIANKLLAASASPPLENDTVHLNNAATTPPQHTRATRARHRSGAKTAQSSKWRNKEHHHLTYAPSARMQMSVGHLPTTMARSGQRHRRAPAGPPMTSRSRTRPQAGRRRPYAGASVHPLPRWWPPSPSAPPSGTQPQRPPPPLPASHALVMAAATSTVFNISHRVAPRSS